ncbi:MAG: M3 family oligoendopeptidase [Planctomycetota bacterium]
MSFTTTPDLGLPELHFLPQDFDPSDKPALEQRVQLLLDRPVESGEELERWTLDWSEIESSVDAALARRYIAMTLDTTDEAVKERYLSFEKEVVPLWRVLDDRLNRRYLDSPYREQQAPELRKRYEVFERKRLKAAEIFREENTKLQAEDAELGARYNEIQGAITVEFRGETLTAQQVSAYLEDPDRATREEAWTKLAKRRLEDREEIEGVFEQMLGIRQKIARNADFADFRDFRFMEMSRFDYTPRDCEEYHDAVEKVVVPAMLELAEERKKRLGIESLRPWDTRVKLLGKEPLKPFRDAEGYKEITRKLFRAVDPVFERDFDILVRNELLDLMSRKGKAPGGYMYPVEDIRLPFIFINAVGVHSDVQTLLHEGGHAFHTILCRDEPLKDYRDAPLEFAEVASMSMELLGLERFETVYAKDDARAAALSHLEDVVMILTWVATIDCFQQWIYTHPGHGRAGRRDKWVEIRTRFAPWIDWSGLEELRDSEWHRQGHLFGMPFYYIEYAIAQIGALQVWQNERRDHDRAIEAYRRGLRLGGSARLPELFETAGLRFAMDEQMLEGLIADLMDRIRELL